MPNPSGMPFEEKVRAAVDAPGPREEFVQDLWIRLAQTAPASSLRRTAARRRMHFRPAWIGVGVVLAALVLATLIIGPTRVYAAIRGLLGYIPGVGIVDQSAPIRVLAEPVSQTRDGVTITVTSATLTADRTHVEYRIFGVPRSAYPDREDVHGCFGSDYLLLPDGTQLERMQDYPPLPVEVTQAVLVIPCIDETLPGTVPENWALPLRFVPAPADLTVMPVIELSPSPEVTAETPAMPEDSQRAPVTFDQVIETSDGYILLGRLMPQVVTGEWAQVTGMPQMRDASEAKVVYTIPSDIQPPEVNDGSGGYGFVLQFEAANLTYPLSLSFPGVVVGPADPAARAQFEFDAGSDPQPGQVWTLNQRIELVGHTLTLVSISTDSRNGYAFKFESGPELYSVSVDLEGHTASGGGGGGGVTGGTFYTSLGYAKLPTGKLMVNVSNLVLVKDRVTWDGLWSPSAPRTDLPAAASQPGLCLTADDIAGLSFAPAELAGRALVYEQLEGSELGASCCTTWPRAIGACSSPMPRGCTLAGWNAIGIPCAGGHPIRTSTRPRRGFSSQPVRGTTCTGPRTEWRSHLLPRAREGVDVVHVDGSGAWRLSDASYASVIGYSPDGTRLYLAVMFTGGSAWMVRVVDVGSMPAGEHGVEADPRIREQGASAGLLVARGESYAREIARFYSTDLAPIQKQLDRLEFGWRVGEQNGRSNAALLLNLRYPFLPELRALVDKGLSFYPVNERDRLRISRRRPRRRGKPLCSGAMPPSFSWVENTGSRSGKRLMTMR